MKTYRGFTVEELRDIEQDETIPRNREFILAMQDFINDDYDYVSDEYNET